LRTIHKGTAFSHNRLSSDKKQSHWRCLLLPQLMRKSASDLRTVDAVVCKWSANTGWLNFSSSRKRLMSAGLNARTGEGAMLSKSRTVTIPETGTQKNEKP